MDASSEQKTCLICLSPNESVRYGIDACRACAMFFKRAQRAGRHIECKNGKRKCTVSRADVSMCRGCRYDKCVSIGMLYEAPLILPNPKSDEEPIPLPKPVPSKSRNADDSLLNRIGKEHAMFFERVRTNELSLVNQHNLERLPHPSEEIYLISFDLAIESFNANIINLWKLFQSVFPSLKDVSNSDQHELFRLWMPAFSLFYSFYRTKEIWGCFTKYMMFTAITCTDKRNPDAWLGPNYGGPMQKELLESMGAYSRNQKELVVPLFEKADICEQEKNALLSFIICESDVPVDFTERHQTFIENIRKETLEDLHRFYTEEMELADYSTRLGNLISLCHTFQEGSALFQEFFRMQVTVFDLYNTETLMRDLVL